MQKLYHLEHQKAISKEAETLLFEGISHEAFLTKGMSSLLPFGIFIKDKGENICGGATGSLFYGSLYIDMLWVDKSLRRKGWGAKLMHAAEKMGREHNCTFATLNTMDWEALPFYQKLGYEIEFTREGYEKKSKMFLLRKSLSSPK